MYDQFELPKLLASVTTTFILNFAIHDTIYNNGIHNNTMSLKISALYVLDRLPVLRTTCKKWCKPKKK